MRSGFVRFRVGLLWTRQWVYALHEGQDHQLLKKDLVSGGSGFWTARVVLRGFCWSVHTRVAVVFCVAEPTVGTRKCRCQYARETRNWELKVKVNLRQVFIKAYALETYYALDWVEWSASRPDRFIPRARAPGTLLRGRRGPSLDIIAEWKVFCLCRASDPIVLSLYRLSYSGSANAIFELE
jgi:hypothetical protein